MKKTLLLIGGGQAHVEVLRQLALNPPAEADVALFNPSPSVLYSGMLPGVIARHYEAAEAKINLWALCQRARVRFFETSVLALNATNKVLESGIWRTASLRLRIVRCGRRLAGDSYIARCLRRNREAC